jgi:putative nucleotidyltransferase with HDIG domain
MESGAVSASERAARMTDSAMNRSVRMFVALVVACGSVPIVLSLVHLVHGHVHAAWLLLAALAVINGPLSIRVASVQATLSVSEAFIFAAALLFGPEAGALSAALDGLAVSLWSRNRRFDRTIFNVTEPALSVWLAAVVFHWLAGVGPLLGRSLPIGSLVGPLLAMTTTYFALNTVLAGTAVWLETRMRPALFLRHHAQHLVLDFCVGVSFGVIIIQNAASPGLGLAIVIVPLLLASYLSSRNAMARLHEANQHVAELRKLYDSTVETLAMAIDAKDQVTHGHIRRVQTLCVRVAKSLSLTDERDLRAIEAAALLHDLGKIAVPEYILNKPGPLSPAEYEQMKTHASAGATILSAIDFPFPVAPIVRHHHENWDGTGYPDGLAGDAIPLAARILAVVDCFDALTSDRPYRRKLATPEALEIIRSRRGRMYDPAVVDQFIASCEAPGADVPELDAHPSPLLAQLKRTSERLPLASLDAAMRWADCEAEAKRAVAALVHSTFDEISDNVASYVRRAFPECTVLLYRYDEASNHLVCESRAVRLPDRSTRTVRLGEGVTGWVGANRRTIANSEASLDLGPLAELHLPPLRFCLSTPVTCDDMLVAVLTLYSCRAPFTEIQRATAEYLASALAKPLAEARRREASPQLRVAANE